MVGADEEFLFRIFLWLCSAVVLSGGMMLRLLFVSQSFAGG